MATVGKENPTSMKPEVAPLFPTFEVGPFAEFNARNVATGMQAGAAMMKGAVSYWGHVGGFFSRRLKSDVDVLSALSGCRTGEDAARAQHGFVSKMLSDYFSEMHALLSIGAETAKGMAEPIENRAEEAIQKMESRAAAAAE